MYSISIKITPKIMSQFAEPGSNIGSWHVVSFEVGELFTNIVTSYIPSKYIFVIN
jgi:hypothetical protein